MTTEIMWRQDNQQQPCFDINTPQIPLDKPIWHTLEECIDIEMLLQGKVPIIIKTGNRYKTNDSGVFSQYQNSGKKITLSKGEV
jgi:hypothetical protein